MSKLIKAKGAMLAPIILTLAMGLNSCGEKSVTIPNTKVYSFKHTIPDSFRNNPDLLSDEYKPFVDGGILFWGGATRNTDDMSNVAFDIGVQFHTATAGRKIFVEKLVLDTPNSKIDRVVNEFVNIDVLSKNNGLYFKRITPFKKIEGNSIPLTADFFVLRVDYRLDDGPIEQKSIKFENKTIFAPII